MSLTSKSKEVYSMYRELRILILILFILPSVITFASQGIELSLNDEFNLTWKISNETDLVSCSPTITIFYPKDNNTAWFNTTDINEFRTGTYNTTLPSFNMAGEYEVYGNCTVGTRYYDNAFLVIVRSTTARETIDTTLSEMRGNFSDVISNQEGIFFINIETPEFWYANNTAFFWVTVSDYLGQAKDADSLIISLYYGNGSIANGSMDVGNSSLGEYNVNITIDASPVTGMYYLQVNTTINSITRIQQRAFRITQSGPFQMIMDAQEPTACIGGKMAINLSAFNEGEGGAETLFRCWIEDIYNNDAVHGLISWYKYVGPKERYDVEIEVTVPSLTAGYYPAKCDYSIPNSDFERMPPITDTVYLDICPTAGGAAGGTGYAERTTTERLEEVKKKVQFLRYKVYQAELERLLFLLLVSPMLMVIYLDREKQRCKKCKKRKRVEGKKYCEQCLRLKEKRGIEKEREKEE